MIPRTCRLRFAPVLLLVVVSISLWGVPAVAEDVIDRYELTAQGTGHQGPAAGRASRMNLVVYRWTTPDEREEMIKTMGGPDGKAILKYLEGREVVGRLMIPGEPGFNLHYLWRVEQDGKTYVVAASERSMLSEPQAVTGDAKFYVGVMQLELDANGKGTGTLMPAIEPVFYTNGTVKIENAVGDPIKITKAEREKKYQEGKGR